MTEVSPVTVKVSTLGAEETASPEPSARGEDDCHDDDGGNPETSPTQKANRRTKKKKDDLQAFLEKNQQSLTDVTERTADDTVMTVETEIWNATNKIVEERLAAERAEDRKQMERTVQRLKEKREKMRNELKKSQQETQQLAKERDSLQKALNAEKKSGEKTLSVHRRALERNDRMQTSADTLRQRIEKLEKERYGWVDERSKLLCTLFDLQAQIQRQKSKTAIASTSKSLQSIPEDKADRNVATDDSVTNGADQEQQKTREDILSSQLEDISQKLDFQGKLLQMKNTELSTMEASKKKLSNDKELLSRKIEINEKAMEGLQKDLQKAKDARRPVQEENKALKHEIRQLKDTIGSFSEQVTLQKVIIKKVKDHIHEGTVAQKQQSDTLLKMCREFEGSCKKLSELQDASMTIVKPPRHSSHKRGHKGRSSVKIGSSEKLAKIFNDELGSKGSP